VFKKLEKLMVNCKCFKCRHGKYVVVTPKALSVVEPRNIKLYGNTAVTYCVGNTGGGGLWRRRDVDRECTGGGGEDDAGQGVASHESRDER
jgi:hypothetical protein